MDFSTLHTVVSWLAGVVEHLQGVFLLGLAAAVVAVWLNLSDRITALERELRRALSAEGTRALSRDQQASLDAQPPTAATALRDPPSSVTAASASPSPTHSAPALAIADSESAAAVPLRQDGPWRDAPPAAGRDAAFPDTTVSTTKIPARDASAPATRSGATTPLLQAVFASGNWLVRSGIVVLFVGVGFLLKFAAEHSVFPLWLRLLGVGLGGIAMLALGGKLTARRRAYGLSLQGGGFGLLYLTLYAAFALYALLTPGAALALMLLVVVVCGWMAHRQRAQALAVMGAIGGFAAPLLASIGSGSHVALFSFYVLLNLGVLGLAFVHTWRALNLTGFIATFMVSALWGHSFWNSTYFATVEPFLVVFFAMYVAIAVAFASLRSIRLQDPMDSTLVFGTPLVALSLQSTLVEHFEYGLACSALALAATYGVLAWYLMRRRVPQLAVLGEAFCALAVGFATLAIALAFDARWSSASWALEGVGLLWVGWRQRRALALFAGAGLQLLAAAAWLFDVAVNDAWNTGAWLGSAMIAVAAVLSSLILNVAARPPEPLDGDDHATVPRALSVANARVLAGAFGLWGLLWWFAAGLTEVTDRLPLSAAPGGWLLFLGLSAVGVEALAARRQWAPGTWVVSAVPLAAGLVAVAQSVISAHPLSDLALSGWPLLLASCAFILHRRGQRRSVFDDSAHVTLLWTGVAVTGGELVWLWQQWLPSIDSWLTAASLMVPAAVVLAVVWLHRGERWPLRGRAGVYLRYALTPLLACLAVGVLVLAVRDPGLPWPLPYLPLLNPIDLATALSLGAMVAWWRACAARPAQPRGLQTAAAVIGGLLAFVWLNGVLLRSVHFWTDLPYTFGALMGSTLVQAAVSVLWAVLALGVMLAGSRLSSRGAWIAGVLLMAAVVLKLMIVDLSGSGTVARIVSFITVGLLLMLVGWLAPVPPRAEAEPAQRDEQKN